jgi:hypothetical protein
MGRFRKRTARASHQTADNNGSVATPHNDKKEKIPDWNVQVRQTVLLYLETYKVRAELAFHGKYNSKKRRDKSAKIGGFEFLKLDYEVVSQPYLPMPPSLYSSHRRAIHECCTERT